MLPENRLPNPQQEMFEHETTEIQKSESKHRHHKHTHLNFLPKFEWNQNPVPQQSQHTDTHSTCQHKVLKSNQNHNFLRVERAVFDSLSPTKAASYVTKINKCWDFKAGKLKSWIGSCNGYLRFASMGLYWIIEHATHFQCSVWTKWENVPESGRNFQSRLTCANLRDVETLLLKGANTYNISQIFKTMYNFFFFTSQLCTTICWYIFWL